jgi:hypothetical protein
MCTRLRLLVLARSQDLVAGSEALIAVGGQ